MPQLNTVGKNGEKDSNGVWWCAPMQRYTQWCAGRGTHLRATVTNCLDILVLNIVIYFLLVVVHRVVQGVKPHFELLLHLLHSRFRRRFRSLYPARYDGLR